MRIDNKYVVGFTAGVLFVLVMFLAIDSLAPIAKRMGHQDYLLSVLVSAGEGTGEMASITQLAAEWKEDHRFPSDGDLDLLRMIVREVQKRPAAAFSFTKEWMRQFSLQPQPQPETQQHLRQGE